MTDFLSMLHRLRIQLILKSLDTQLSVLQLYLELDSFEVARFGTIPGPMNFKATLEVVNSTLHLTHALLCFVVLG